MDLANNEIRDMQERASAAFEAGQLGEAAALYQRLCELRPDGDAFHYRLGLARKYLREWPDSLRHNLRSLALSDEHDEAASWNAGIAATAIGDWAEARRQWQACGIDIDPGEGPIEENFGPIGLRLNPWGNGETLFARRIDPARARVANVPLPESGHRYGDLVLHDGAQTGERHYFDHMVPVFNELQRLEASPFITWAVFANAASDEDVDALQRIPTPGIGLVEDWTATLKNLCLRCSYGVPHRHERHEAGNDDDWNPDRTLGVAAETELAVRSLLEAWVAEDPGHRRLDAIECREQAAPGPAPGHVWWRGPKAS
jgi:tetratricopeptide (TPR) repeat protein